MYFSHVLCYCLLRLFEKTAGDVRSRFKTLKRTVCQAVVNEELGSSDMSFDERERINVICPQYSPVTCRWQDTVIKTLEPDS